MLCWFHVGITLIILLRLFRLKIISFYGNTHYAERYPCLALLLKTAKYIITINAYCPQTFEWLCNYLQYRCFGYLYPSHNEQVWETEAFIEFLLIIRQSTTVIFLPKLQINLAWNSRNNFKIKQRFHPEAKMSLLKAKMSLLGKTFPTRNGTFLHMHMTFLMCI